MTQPLRIALLGCGAMGAEAARRVYAAAPGDRYRVVAAIDVRPERAAGVGQLVGAPAYPSVAAALAAGCAIDAVDVRLPHHLHAEHAVEALAANRHVLIEKPLATTRADAERIRAAADASSAVAAVAENYPHLAAVQAARRALDDGAIGAVRALRTTRAYTLAGVWVRDGWRQDGGPSAGILLDQGTHHVSLARQLAGDISAVSAVTGADDETVLLTLRFRAGITGHSLFTWGTPARPDECEAEVFGATGRLAVHVCYDDRLGRAERYAAEIAAPVRLSAGENYDDSHGAIVDDWVAAARGEHPPRVTVAEAAADLAVVLAAAESLRRNGEFVSVQE